VERELGAGNGDVGVEINRAIGVGEESSPGVVGGEGVVLGAGETVSVRHGGGGDRVGGGVWRRGGTYKSSSTPTPLRSSTSQHLLAAFLLRFAGGGKGAGGDMDARAKARVARAAGAQAGLMVEPIGLADETCEWVLQH
jgi:hypothetical protein